MVTQEVKYNLYEDKQNSELLAASFANRPRVVLIHPSAGVCWSGGSEIFAIELARHLTPYFEITLLSGANCGDFSRISGGIPRSDVYNFVRNPLIAPFVYRFATHPDILIEHLTNFLPCLLYLLTNPVDLIFPCNDYGGLMVAACVRAIKGTPILFTEHVGLMGNGRSLSRNLKFHPNKLVVFSSEIAEFARHQQPNQAINIIPNGVDLSHFTPEGEKIDFGLSGPIILCVASLKRQSHKRVELAMQAVSRLSSGSLLLCGDGLDREYFQNLGEELLGKQRFAVRSFSYDQMPQVYRSADIFTLPSIDEPFGLAYIEAMASGVPVVATDDAMRRYIIGNAGIVCDVTNPDIYAQALKNTLERDWKILSRENAMRFSWEAIASMYRDAILETIYPNQKQEN